MRYVAFAALLSAILFAGCAGASNAASCAEYAAEVESLIESGASPEEIEAFMEDSGEHVAKLIADDPDHAEACAEAVFNALFTAEFAQLEQELSVQLAE